MQHNIIETMTGTLFRSPDCDINFVFRENYAENNIELSLDIIGVPWVQTLRTFYKYFLKADM